MFQKNTEDLLQELKAEKDIESYFSKNQNEMAKKEFYEYLLFYMEKKNLSKVELICRSGLNRIYGYEILRGEKLPSRNKAIALSIGLGLELEDTQRFLKLAGHRELYSRDKRDAVILLAITKHLKLMEINELLFDRGFEIL